LLTNATQADPDNATGWGSLALGYAALKRVSPVRDRAGLAARSRSAAEKALNLDQHEPRAAAALLLVEPVYRRWLSAETAARAALGGSPPIPLLFFILSDALGSVGRWDEAAQVSNKFDRKKFLIPGADRRVVVDLWSAGDIQGADEALRLAVEHWPQQPQVWRTRLAYLMHSGRASEALALVDADSQRPPGTPTELVEAFRSTAEVLSGRGNASTAVGRNLAYLSKYPAAVFGVAHACAALGQSATLLAVLNGYYFAQGDWASVAPPGGDEDRQTSALFQPPMRDLWRTAEFETLLHRIGLTAYWSASGTLPDYRRSA